MTERVLALHGELDLPRRTELQALLAAHDDAEPLVVDLADVDFIDLQSLVLLRTRPGPTELRHAPPLAERVLAFLV